MGKHLVDQLFPFVLPSNRVKWGDCLQGQAAPSHKHYSLFFFQRIKARVIKHFFHRWTIQRRQTDHPPDEASKLPNNAGSKRQQATLYDRPSIPIWAVPRADLKTQRAPDRQQIEGHTQRPDVSCVKISEYVRIETGLHSAVISTRKGHTQRPDVRCVMISEYVALYADGNSRKDE
jgi:hypothetical protein